MKETFLNIRNQIKNKFGGSSENLPQEHMPESDYVELSHNSEGGNSKVKVQQFIITDFEDIKPILDSLRTGNTIALVNIQPLKEKDLIELKRAVNKLKKTCDALGGDIAGFGEDYLVATPEFAYIHREKSAPVYQEPAPSNEFDPI
jgi:SepF-like predicted cell division protein (DUF552 family)